MRKHLNYSMRINRNILPIIGDAKCVECSNHLWYHVIQGYMVAKYLDMYMLQQP